MFRKFKLRKNISNCKKRIEALEFKRSRSQAALMEAILSNTTPSDQETDYFNKYTERINSERERMHRYMEELAALKAPKK
ncbi:MAG: hypothetical protein J6023_00335 [Clostridia bacterium]|nr:hypothetical protein [Clostridia bacterium]